MQKIGKTVVFDKPPIIVGHAGVAGKKEGEGPLAKDFDRIFEDTTMGQQSYELAESAMLHDAIIRSLSNADVSPSAVDFVLSGDLLDQCMGSAFALKDLEIASIGLFGACSTMALSLSAGAMLVDGGINCVVCATSSHFCSSERQFRFPLEYGGQRPPTAQWTVTGAAMAPAASRTISTFLKDTKTSPSDYDLILTGDLGYTGTQLLYELLEKDHNIKLKGFHKDCGMLIYDLKKQDVNSGGSGCGCSASVLCSHIMKQIDKGILKKVLFVATGALMSPTSSKQGNPIPGIAHAVLLEG